MTSRSAEHVEHGLLSATRPGQPGRPSGNPHFPLSCEAQIVTTSRSNRDRATQRGRRDSAIQVIVDVDLQSGRVDQDVDRALGSGPTNGGLAELSGTFRNRGVVGSPKAQVQQRKPYKTTNCVPQASMPCAWWPTVTVARSSEGCTACPLRLGALLSGAFRTAGQMSQAPQPGSTPQTRMPST